MNISSVSSTTDSLAAAASNLQSGNIARQISVAVMKQVLDGQKQQGEALVQMIQNTPSLDGTGSILDIRA